MFRACMNDVGYEAGSKEGRLMGDEKLCPVKSY